MKIKFREVRLNAANKERLEVVNSIIQEYQEQDLVLTLRQLYYQLVSRDIIANKLAEYSKLSTLLREGRMGGIVDWDAIEDRLRRPSKPSSFETPKDGMEALISQYALPRMKGQKYYIETWCFPFDTPIVTNEGVSDIGAIAKGDFVLTKEGSYNKVTDKMVRKYQGDLIKIEAIGLLPSFSTPEHPYFAALKKSKASYKGSARKIFPPDFINSGELSKFDYLTIPRIKKVTDKKQIVLKSIKRTSAKIIDRLMIDYNFCKVIGFYLAEGSIRGDGRTIQFTFHRKETDYAKVIIDWAKKLGLNPFTAYGKGTFIVYVSNKGLSNWFSLNFGNGSYNKKLPNWALFLPRKKQYEIIKCHFLGDGTLNDKYRPSVYVSTKSRTLAIQEQLIFIRNGIVPCLKTKQDSTGTLYRLSLSGKSGRKVCRELGFKFSSTESREYNFTRIDDDFAYFPINKISKKPYSGDVYNITVEKSNTYCIPNIVHNCEKDALSGVLKRVTEKYHIPILVNRGYSSASAMFDSYQRFKKADEEGYKAIIILYLGDFDPRGIDMIRDISDRIMEFSRKHYEEFPFNILPIALNKAQIAKYNPPPNPAKRTDPRAKAFIELHGGTSWEVDALPPNVLNKLLDDSIQKYIDNNLYKKIVSREMADKNKLNKAMAKL
jgi:hypothetical protein